jgi:hypothetical protein
MSHLTEEFISQKLAEAEQNALDSDGYAEMPIKPGTRLKCAAVLLPLTYYGMNGMFSLPAALIESNPQRPSLLPWRRM